MLNTEHTRAVAFTNRADKSLDQNIGKHKPQYLDVALAQSKGRDTISNTKPVNNGRSDKKGLSSVSKEHYGLKRAKINAFTGKHLSGLRTDRSTKTDGSTVSKKIVKESKTDRPTKGSEHYSTFQEKARFESQKNKKLYEQLDRQLAGEYGMPYPDSNEEAQPIDNDPHVRLNRNEAVTLITKNSLYPSVAREIRDKYTTGNLPHTGVVKAKKSLGEENENLQQRELKAKARLDSLDRIDSFSIGDFTRKKHRQPLPVPTSQDSGKQTNTAISAEPKATISFGIPINAGIQGSRRHIVADVPVFLPSFAGGNQPVEPIVKDTKPIPVDRVFQNTIPGVKAEPVVNLVPKGHAPEAFVGPVPGLDSFIAGTQVGDATLNTYRHHGNPISERLLREQSERENALLEHENLKYFDEEGNESQLSGEKSVPATLFSDPGPQRDKLDKSSDTHVTTPEGYLAQRERHARLEKEARILKKADAKEAFGTNRKQPENQYQVDYYAQRTRSEIRRQLKLEKEDSWIKSQLEKPRISPVAMEGFRGNAGSKDTRMISERDERYGTPTTYRVEDSNEKYRPHRHPEDERRDRNTQPDRERLGQEKNRPYRLQDDESRDYVKDRNTQQDRDRLGQESYKDAMRTRDVLPYDSKYEREKRNVRRDQARQEERQQYDAHVRDSGIRQEQDRQRHYNTGDNQVESQGNNREHMYGNPAHLPATKDDFKGNGRRMEQRTSDGHATENRDNRDRTFKPSDKDSEINPSKRGAPYSGSTDNRIAARQQEPKRTGGEKVQYVIRTKSSEIRKKSRASQKSEPLPENVPPSSTELVREKSMKSFKSSQFSTDSEVRSKNSPRENNLDNDDKHKPINKDSHDQALEQFFDEQVGSHGNHDNVSFTEGAYGKQKQGFRNGDLMTPVQELSIKLSDDDTDPNAVRQDKGNDMTDRIKFLSSNENKHEFKEDRRSPWKQDNKTLHSPRSASLKDEPPSHLLEDLSSRKSESDNGKGPDSVKYMKERIREKTIEKMKEKEVKREIKKRERERTMDSQGPTDVNEMKAGIEEEDFDDVDLNEIEEEMDEKELYVCYLLTDNGEKIGPLRLDIEDVKIGLPNGEKLKKQGEEIEEEEGMRNRQTGSHGLNEFSSRSHSMLMLTIDSEMQDPDDENLYMTKRGKLTFVDLAGSEKVKDSNSSADTLVESNSINKSLLVLGNCISSLGDHKRRQGHIPYRDSKLTKLLADSLGGNGVTLMICCITPSSHHAYETMNTLRYASRAKKIRTKPVVKMDPREKLILSLKREIKVLRNENHYLRQQLDFPAKPKGQLQKENDQKFAQMVKETNGNQGHTNIVTAPPHPDKLKQQAGQTEEGGLYEMLQEYMVENEALRTENAEMQVNKDKIRQDQQSLYRDNERLMKRVDDLERRLNQASHSWQSMPRQGSHPSRDPSPRGSPQHARGGGSGGKAPPPRLPPPSDLPLRDPVYPGSPPQSQHGKPSPQPRGPPGTKPPHRLPDNMPPQRPVYEQNGPVYMNGHPPGPGQPALMGHPVTSPPQPFPNNQYRPAHIASPNRGSHDHQMDSRRSSQASTSDAIRDMNERLRQELMQLDGEIHHHQNISQRPAFNMR